jgi:hypothetical protein
MPLVFPPFVDHSALDFQGSRGLLLIVSGHLLRGGKMT